jgi:hypothetical protein
MLKKADGTSAKRGKKAILFAAINGRSSTHTAEGGCTPIRQILLGSRRFIPAAEGGCAPKNISFWLRLRRAVPHKPSGQNITGTARPSRDLAARKVNGFWGGVCQDVPFRSATLAENPIDCRIFFADNARRKTESGIGGKNP